MKFYINLILYFGKVKFLQVPFQVKILFPNFLVIFSQIAIFIYFNFSIMKNIIVT